MNGTSNALVRHVRIAVTTGLLVAVSGSSALSNENCRQLEALARQYAGVQLTSSQQQIKRQMVAWYKKNCGSVHTATARRDRTFSR